MKKLWMKIKLLFTKAGKVVKEAVVPAIKVTNIIKDIVESPVTSTLVSLTPFIWDDAALKLAKQIVPKALIELQVIEGLQGKTNDEVIRTIIAEVKQYTPSKKAQFYEDLAVMISSFLADGKVSQDELLKLVQFIYQNRFQK